jgi:hypothetical protein
MSILATNDVGSSSVPQSKCRRRYVNHNRETAHLRLHHRVFDDDCVYPPTPPLPSRHTSIEGTVCGEVFS